jgi:hypothetical protein
MLCLAETFKYKTKIRKTKIVQMRYPITLLNSEK